MIQLTPQMRILLAVEPTDFRRGIDGLAQQCRQVLDADPFSGVVIAFCNRARTSVKILVYDGQGFWLCQKRFSAGRLRFWPTAVGKAAASLQAHELQVLLRGGDPASTKAASELRPIA